MHLQDQGFAFTRHLWLSKPDILLLSARVSFEVSRNYLTLISATETFPDYFRTNSFVIYETDAKRRSLGLDYDIASFFLTKAPCLQNVYIDTVKWPGLCRPFCM